MRLSAGPNITAFAALCETTEEDVLAWANSQVNDPLPAYAEEYPTKKDRANAIKGYLMYRLADNPAAGITERVKASIQYV